MKQELWTSGKDVSMAKILDARENRVQIQQEKSPCLLPLSPGLLYLKYSRSCKSFSVHKMDL